MLLIAFTTCFCTFFFVSKAVAVHVFYVTRFSLKNFQ
uniref:BLTX395 n=1 Tax=Nephila pilipes TaxID=299642 RepID=A0A076L021_NEPPI|nr:BLTX395 [Nephila pilipes]